MYHFRASHERLRVWSYKQPAGAKSFSAASALGMSPIVRGPRRDIDVLETHGRWQPTFLVADLLADVSKSGLGWVPMKTWFAICAAALATASVANAYETAAQTAMRRPPASGPGPTFPDLVEVDMSGICPAMRELQRSGERERSNASSRRLPRRGGRVVLDCALSEDGKPSSCYVLHEEPEGYGVGDAAIRLACLFETTLPQRESEQAASASGRDTATIELSSDPNATGSRIYRRNGESEPWRLRFPVRFQQE